MAVKIRLRRMGQKKAPYYRIVVADSMKLSDLNKNLYHKIIEHYFHYMMINICQNK